MRSFPSPFRRLKPAFLVLAISAAFATKPVLADEGDVFNFYVGRQRIHDSNVFRLAPEVEASKVLGNSHRDDVIQLTYFGVTVDQRIGRQLLALDVSQNQYRYQNFDFLNYDGDNLKGRFDWVVTDVLTGSIRKNKDTTLAGFGDVRLPIKNIVTRESEGASANLLLQPDWRLETGLSRSQARNGSALYKSGDSNGETRNIGLRYMPHSENFLLLRASRDDGEYINRTLAVNPTVDNVYHQNNAGIDFLWQGNGVSRFTGAIGRSERKHPNVPARDMAGTLGNLAWDWKLTGASTLTSKVWRDVSSAGDSNLATTILTNAKSLVWQWQASAKTSSRLQFEHRKLDYVGDPVNSLIAAEQRRDTVRSASLNLNYRPMNSLGLTAGMTREHRDSNYVGIPYRVHTMTLGAQFSF